MWLVQILAHASMQELKVLVFSSCKSRMKAASSQEDCFAVSLKSNRIEKRKKSPASHDLRTIISRKLSKNAGQSTSAHVEICVHPGIFGCISFEFEYLGPGAEKPKEHVKEQAKSCSEPKSVQATRMALG